MKLFAGFLLVALPLFTTGAPASPSYAEAQANLGACTASGATGAGLPLYTVDVGAPARGDSEPEIQAAITKAANHGSGDVVLASGTYKIDSSINLASNVELSGSGEGSTVVQAAEANFSLLEISGVSNVTLSNFTINANGLSLPDMNDTENYVVNIPNSTNVIVQEIATEEDGRVPSVV